MKIKSFIFEKISNKNLFYYHITDNMIIINILTKFVCVGLKFYIKVQNL